MGTLRRYRLNTVTASSYPTRLGGVAEGGGGRTRTRVLYQTACIAGRPITVPVRAPESAPVGRASGYSRDGAKEKTAGAAASRAPVGARARLSRS